MASRDDPAGTIIIVLIVVCVLLGILLANAENLIKKQAIERGYARYHPVSGKWEWIEPECPKIEKEETGEEGE